MFVQALEIHVRQLSALILSLALSFLPIQVNYQVTTPRNQVLSSRVSCSASAVTRLKIPKIGVDAVIEDVGLLPNGEMGVPGNTTNVGWFSLGTRPGEIGSAVITGHVNLETGAAAVFTNLNQLVVGDKLLVENGKGVVAPFVVREKRSFDPGYADEVFTSSSGSHLNLVTCEGVWNNVQKSYSKRLVVFADKLVLDN